MDDLYKLWKEGKMSLKDVREAIWDRFRLGEDDPTELGELLAKISKESDND